MSNFEEIPYMDQDMANKMSKKIVLSDFETMTDMEMLEKIITNTNTNMKTKEKLLNAIRLARRNYLGRIKGFQTFRDDLSAAMPGFPTNAAVALFFGGIKSLKDLKYKQGPNEPNLRSKANSILDEARGYWQFSGEEIPTVWMGILSALAKFNPGDGIGPSRPREP
jgi:hypothetical protein